jgi:hypothetical protein
MIYFRLFSIKLSQFYESGHVFCVLTRINTSCFTHSFETQPGPVGRPGARTGLGWKKIGEGKIRCDPAIPGQKPDCNPLTFVLFFLLKRRRFDLKKIDSVKTRNLDLGPGCPPGRIWKLWFYYIMFLDWIFFFNFIIWWWVYWKLGFIICFNLLCIEVIIVLRSWSRI